MFARTLSRIGAVTLLTFGIVQGCASEGDESVTTSNDDDNTTAAGGTTGQGGDGPTTVGNGGSGATGGGEGGAGNSPYECGEDISEANLESLPADLIVVVDNSDSMAFEAGQVKNQMNGLVSAITATGIDAHVIVISKESDDFIFNPLDTGVCLAAPLGSGSCPNDENLPAYRHVVEEVSSTDALSKVISTYDQWKDNLRPNATKTFLVVSDDDSDMTAGDFTTALANLDPPITDFKFNAIVASESPISCATCVITGCGSCTNPCCDKTLACVPLSAAEGQTYETLQNQSGGVYGDLCQQNFIPTFSNMAQAVIEHTQISCTFDIPTPPDSVVVPEETNVDFIPSPGSTPQGIFNVPSGLDCTINGGWYFDNNVNPTTITLCETTCNNVKESTEGAVRVKYGCQTETVPD